MIANISCDFTEADESLATCRFAQRVACIQQDARVNEELDAAAVIANLRRRMDEMEARPHPPPTPGPDPYSGR